jgi:hypothetical protein
MNLGLEDLGSSGRELANIDSEGESPNTSFSVFSYTSSKTENLTIPGKLKLPGAAP